MLALCGLGDAFASVNPDRPCGGFVEGIAAGAAHLIKKSLVLVIVPLVRPVVLNVAEPRCQLIRPAPDRSLSSRASLLQFIAARPLSAKVQNLRGGLLVNQ